MFVNFHNNFLNQEIYYAFAGLSEKYCSHYLRTIHIHLSMFLLQVIHMQCNVETVEEGARYHVSHVISSSALRSH